MANTPGKGTIVKISIAETPTAIAQLVGVTPPQMEMGTTETTHLTSSAREFIANILDGGTVDLTINYDSADASHAAILSQFKAGTLAVFSIEFNDAGDTTVGFSGVMTNHNWGEATVESLVTLTVTIKVSGDVTVTP